MSVPRRQDARSQLANLKRHLVAVISAEERLYQRYSEASHEADRWRQRAGLAVRRGDDDLARAALIRSARHEDEAAEFYRQYLEQKGYVEELKQRLLRLETQPGEARTKLQPVDVARLERNLASLKRWQERDRDERARLAAWAELDRDEVVERLDALERADRLDRQLAEMKERLGRK